MSSTIRLSYLPGLTLTGKLRNAASATTLETLTFTEVGGESGEYTATTAEVNQVCTLAILSSGNKVADTIVRLGADAGTYRAGLQSTFSSSLDSVTAGAIANNAITAAAIAADAVTEIQAGLALAADLATVSGSGGDATEANQDIIISKLDQVIADGITLAAAEISVNTITGFPEELVIGDSYTSAVGRAITVYTVDSAGDPISGIGTLDFVDATVSFTFSRDRDNTPITGSTATFTDGVTPYVTISIPATVTAQAKAEYSYIGVVKFTWSSPAAVYTFRTAAFTFIE